MGETQESFLPWIHTNNEKSFPLWNAGNESCHFLQITRFLEIYKLSKCRKVDHLPQLWTEFQDIWYTVRLKLCNLYNLYLWEHMFLDIMTSDFTEKISLSSSDLTYLYPVFKIMSHIEASNSLYMELIWFFSSISH